LGLPEGVRLKLNGTFGRWLFLLDEDDCLHQVYWRIQTAVWFDERIGKWHYVSIFPHFIKRYCSPSLDLLEYISCTLGKGEDVFRHIDDPEEILDSEDRITMPIRQIEREADRFSYPALLNSRYTEVYNRPLNMPSGIAHFKARFSILYNLVITARQFFGRKYGVLSLVNTVVNL
jgi:hypothetical protein